MAENTDVPLAPGSSRTTVLAVAAGLTATFVSAGLVRFAYTALLPHLIAAKWFGVSDINHLAAATLAGYCAPQWPHRKTSTAVRFERGRCRRGAADHSHVAQCAAFVFHWPRQRVSREAYSSSMYD